MANDNGAETLTIEELAAQMLGMVNDGVDEDGQPEYADSEESEPQAGHPAWQQILNAVPAEYHNALMPTLQQWDAGVSRRFQKIHDEYEPYKQFEDLDPDDIKEALNVYQALTSDPAATWEAIGRVYGLSPQQVSQAASDEDFDLDDLPASVRDRLLRLDDHERAIQSIYADLEQRQAFEKEAAEDEALDDLLGELAKEYGEFDEDYVVGLIAAGVDGDEAVYRYQQIANRYQAPQPSHRNNAPQVMSSGGGVPSADGVNVTALSNQDTQSLIAEILRLSHNNQ